MKKIAKGRVRLRAVFGPLWDCSDFLQVQTRPYGGSGIEIRVSIWLPVAVLERAEHDPLRERAYFYLIRNTFVYLENHLRYSNKLFFILFMKHCYIFSVKTVTFGSFDFLQYICFSKNSEHFAFWKNWKIIIETCVWTRSHGRYTLKFCPNITNLM